jgi:glycerol-3-phosphate O-acyltransferase
MQIDRKYRLFFLWIAQKILYLWARSKSFPSEHASKLLGLDADRPICYLFKSHSWIDWCILDYHCIQLNLPRPIYEIKELRNEPQGAYLYLFKTGLFQQIHNQQSPQILQLVRKCAAEKLDVQLIPVSIFRGRNPGKEEKSLLKLLFFDDENGGLFQKFLTFCVQGRQIVCHFGNVISLSTLIAENREDTDTARKLQRVVRVHFRKQREATLGPYLYDRNHVVSSLISSREIQKTIDREAQRSQQPRQKVEAAAYKYADEIAAKFMFPVLLFFDTILSWLWKKMYRGVEVQNAEYLHNLSEQADIVYLPCHRSHMDYLLFGYSIYNLGLMPPHTAAGVNLNFWPIGPLFRRGGAFFLRRSFAGNRLYGAVFSEYVHDLLTRGFPISFYIEGGRSRTGYLLPPKTGLLSMVVQSALRSRRRPLVLVPVYISYDRLMEGGSYIREIRGKTKKAESLSQLLKARKLLKSEFGKAYISFAPPIYLDDFLGKEEIQESVSPLTQENIGKSLTPITQRLAREAMIRINEAAVVTPVSLFATALLTAPQKAMVEEELLRFAHLLLSLLEKTGKGNALTFSKENLKEQLTYAEGLTALQRFSDKGGDVLYINEQEKLLVTYYRNNMVHLFALSSMMAGFFQHNHEVEKEALLIGCSHIYPFIREEFHLPWEESEVLAVFESHLEAFLSLELLRLQGTKVQRCDVGSHAFSHLKFLGNMLRDTFEKYAIFSALLLRQSEESMTTAPVSVEQFETECHIMLQRLSILNRVEDSNFIDKHSLQRYLGILAQKQYITLDSHIHVGPAMMDVTSNIMELLSSDIRDSIQQSCSLPPSSIEES